MPSGVFKMKLKKGDEVEVIAGKWIKNRGKILRTDPRRNRVLVEKVNIVKRHQRPTMNAPQGGIVEKENWIDASNVMLVDPKTGERTRIGRKRLENGRLVRVARRSGEVLD